MTDDVEGREVCRCDKCGGTFPIAELDAKPRMTLWLFLVYLLDGQSRWLQYAADHGYDFDQLECRNCYGLEYEAPMTLNRFAIGGGR